MFEPTNLMAEAAPRSVQGHLWKRWWVRWAAVCILAPLLLVIVALFWEPVELMIASPRLNQELDRLIKRGGACHVVAYEPDEIGSKWKRHSLMLPPEIAKNLLLQIRNQTNAGLRREFASIYTFNVIVYDASCRPLGSVSVQPTSKMKTDQVLRKLIKLAVAGQSSDADCPESQCDLHLLRFPNE